MNDRLIRACRREPVDRTPVWMMRQAGRYLKEYREIRQKVSFLDLCKNVDLAAEVSLQPLRILGVDAVIFFSDILIPVEAMGVHVALTDKGPEIAQPIRTNADVEQLRIPDPADEVPFVGAILKRLRSELARRGSADRILRRALDARLLHDRRRRLQKLRRDQEAGIQRTCRCCTRCSTSSLRRSSPTCAFRSNPARRSFSCSTPGRAN